MTPDSLFHPAVAAWFDRSFAAPTAAQAQAWPAFQAGRHVLIAAPTGSGKTLAAFLAAIDGLVRQGLNGGLKDETQIVYVSPLEAMSRFLVGAGTDKTTGVDCTIVDTGHRRARDLALELPDSPLEAVMSAEVWEQIYQRMTELIEAHRTTLIFVNTRRLVERVT